MLLLLLVLLPVEAFGAIYVPEKLDAEVVYMISLDNDAVIVDVNSNRRVAPASITKVVTAMVVLENCTDYDELVEASSYAIHSLDGTNSSTAGIRVGEQLTVRQLLYCMMVASANEAANILAEYIANGDINAFVDMMNSFVAGLGCTGTHFMNPHGLDADGHYSTARDLALIYRYCLNNALFCEIAGTYEIDIPPTNEYDYVRHLRSTNSLFNDAIPDYYSPYVKTGKTGTTDNAGRCVISSASNDGYNYLLVVLEAKFYDYDEDGYDENMAFVESRKLYKWAYDNLRLREVANPSQNVCEIRVELAKKYDYIVLVPAESVTALVPVGVNAESVMYEVVDDATADSVNAPVRKGDVLGKAEIKYAGQTVAEVDLVAAFDIERSTPKYLWYRIKTFFSTKPMKILLLFVLCVLLPFLIIVFVVLPRVRRSKKRAAKVVERNDNRHKR
ncbi:MAG: D-alanyl-D-alanine carboxypeptidase [Clostridia bacterium]|nr:D-alanyl-D-alanine carboxypeptidase [Clostridia bacterium]